ncbi:hypothetical protein TNIN_416441 [Trichonephila inaurata madagascariensis]|uniref:Uncharacterized protein n=1 Tax=Trichonephila inaurata madagascariensis TaxID=2747483 RepID=A0A8X6X2D0_9ARAC|nr:hypothetical protein TNIN_416441 [Trichonephila inaurata madagascariensis]
MALWSLSNASATKGLPTHLIFSHHIAIPSLKQSANILGGPSLLSQTGPVNGHLRDTTRPLCLQSYWRRRSRSQTRTITPKPCIMSPTHKANHMCHCYPILSQDATDSPSVNLDMYGCELC